MHTEGVRGAVQRELPVLFSEGAVHLSASSAILHARITLLAALQRELLKRLKVCTAHPRSSIQAAAQRQAASSQCQWNVQREFRAVFARALISTSCSQVVATNVAAVEVTLSCNIPFYTAHNRFSLLFCNATAPEHGTRRLWRIAEPPMLLRLPCTTLPFNCRKRCVVACSFISVPFSFVFVAVHCSTLLHPSRC